MNLKGKEQMAKKIVRTIKLMLNEEKRDPIKMKGKEDLGMDSVWTVGATTNVEIEIGQENLKEAIQLSSEIGNKQTNHWNLKYQLLEHQLRKRKPQNHCQTIFYGSRKYKYR